ncbi:MAG: uroporphyrinogen decarboxylase family protein [Nibricoccus sp.]
MERKFYLDLAASGLRMPIGTHLVLHQHTEPETILHDGKRLGAILIETAERFKTPLAIPLMDLTLEKEALLSAMGLPKTEISQFHFNEPPDLPKSVALTPRMKASCEAIAHVAKTSTLVPMGMSIGPFSLMTKLLADPITPVFLAGTGATATEEPDVALVEAALHAGEMVIAEYLDAQIAAGAKAVIVCEPAANVVYFSPKQLELDFTVFDRFVMTPMRRIAQRLAQRGVDLIFHDCGELTDGMVKRFASLGAAMISLGSSRKLWEDAAYIPKDTVLYGNLPTKRFYAAQLTIAEVERMAGELLAKMRAVGHPFILGSECDVLSVPGSEQAILGKVDAFMRCGCCV